MYKIRSSLYINNVGLCVIVLSAKVNLTLFIELEELGRVYADGYRIYIGD